MKTVKHGHIDKSQQCLIHNTGNSCLHFLRQQFEKAIKAFDTMVKKTGEIIRPGRMWNETGKRKTIYNDL
jgi:hypothetical protein